MLLAEVAANTPLDSGPKRCRLVVSGSPTDRFDDVVPIYIRPYPFLFAFSDMPASI